MLEGDGNATLNNTRGRQGAHQQRLLGRCAALTAGPWKTNQSLLSFSLSPETFSTSTQMATTVSKLTSILVCVTAGVIRT